MQIYSDFVADFSTCYAAETFIIRKNEFDF